MSGAGPAHAMTVEALIERARQPVRLLLDTNVVFLHRRLNALCKVVNRLNASGGAHIDLLVSAVVHAEKLFDLRQEHREDYDLVHALKAMKAGGLRVVPFETRHADVTAELLARSFPTDKAWCEAKRKRCVNCLGLGKTGMNTPGKGTTCGATVDWLIAGHAQAEQCILVTDDRGPEFREVVDKIRVDTLEQALDRMLAGAAEPGKP